MLGVLAPLGRKGIARAFGSSVKAALTRQLAALKAGGRAQAAPGADHAVMKALLGQALIQLVRSQHAAALDNYLRAAGWTRFESPT